jgi:hypothetical protein
MAQQYPQQPANSPQQQPQPHVPPPHYGQPPSQMPNGAVPQQYPNQPANPPYPQQQYPQPPAPAPYPHQYQQQYPQQPPGPAPYRQQPPAPYQQPYAPAQGAPQPYPPAPSYPQAPQFPPQQPHQYPNPPMPGPPMPPQQQYQNPPMAGPPQMQPQMQQAAPPWSNAPMPAPSHMPHMPHMPQPQAPQMPPAQSGPPVGFPPPMSWTPPRDALVSGAAPFLESGEQVYYGFPLKLDDTIAETPRELMIAIEGQHHTLGEINRAQHKINRGMKWAFNPMDAASEMIAEKSVEALNRKLAGPVFLGGWESQAGWFIRFARATREDYGPGAWGVITSHRYIIFRAGRMGGAAMRMVYAVPRTTIAGVRLEGTKDAMMHGRTPRAELHFTDGSMVATMMAAKQGEQLAAILQVQQNGRQGY